FPPGRVSFQGDLRELTMFKPISIGGFNFTKSAKDGRHPSHGMGMPARLTGENGRTGVGTLARVSLTLTRSPYRSSPSFRAPQVFSVMAILAARTVDGSFNPADFH